jgi:hypothetical protein
MAAAASSAIMHERTKTRKLQPNILLAVIGTLSALVGAVVGWT